MSDLKALQRQIAELSAAANRMAGDDQAVLFREFANEILERKLASPVNRVNTKRSFETQIRIHLIPAFGHLPIDKIKNDVWLDWVNQTREKGVLSRFFNARKTLIYVLGKAVEERHIDKLPTIDLPDEKREVGRTMERGEVIRILRKCQRPFRFIFYVFWKMACRPREILQWTWSMIRWGEPGKTWIDIPGRITKTGRSRSIPINPAVSRIIAIRNRRGNGSPYVFPSTRNPMRPQTSYQSAWEVACRKAGLEKKAVPYDLRRTFITKSAAEGKPLVYLAKALDTSVRLIENTYARTQADVMEAIIK